MRCISPLTFRKGSVINTVPCGKCNFCLQNRRNDWTFRIEQEVKHSKSAFFLTLTYDEKHVPIINNNWATLRKKDFQDFMKRLRKKDEEIKSKKQYATSGLDSIKYYAVGEYGSTTLRPHYHAIIVNLEPETVTGLDQIWKLGHTSVGTAETASIHYCTKYVIQPTSENLWAPMAPPFSLISKGVGKAYLDTNGFHHKESRKNTVVGNLGEQRLPRYYASRIFNIREKELLAKTSLEQGDILHRETIEDLLIRNPDDATIIHDKIIKDKHDYITKSIKQNQDKNETI